MIRGAPVNIAASVRQKLMNFANKTGDDPNVIWTRYAIERLIYRLSISEFSGEFVLKGAVLFMVWSNEPHRPTMDLDLLGYGEDSNERIAAVFRRICQMDSENDGLMFDEKSIRVMPIREGMEYQGRRVNLVAYLGKARIAVQVDIGFGDAVTPKPEIIQYPTILDFPAPRIRAYSQSTVVAEKFHAMVILGITNSRMKDFYDLHALASQFVFDGSTLVKAVKATFRRRKTAVPAIVPMALTEEFGLDSAKCIQWNAFVRKSGVDKKAPELLKVLSLLQEFLLPVMEAASGKGSLLGHWNARGPWSAV
jgi:predicted nucleotidyltransferase component of viral defense system